MVSSPLQPPPLPSLVTDSLCLAQPLHLGTFDGTLVLVCRHKQQKRVGTHVGTRVRRLISRPSIPSSLTGHATSSNARSSLRPFLGPAGSACVCVFFRVCVVLSCVCVCVCARARVRFALFVFCFCFHASLVFLRSSWFFSPSILHVSYATFLPQLFSFLACLCRACCRPAATSLLHSIFPVGLSVSRLASMGRGSLAARSRMGKASMSSSST